MVMMFIPSDKRETLVCIRKTATRHKRGEGNRSDRNLKATSKGRKNREIEKTQKREEKVASFGCAGRDSMPEGSHAPEIPNPTPAVNLRFDNDGKGD